MQRRPIAKGTSKNGFQIKRIGLLRGQQSMSLETLKDRVFIQDLADMLDYSYQHTRRAIITRGDFPAPYKIGNRMWWKPEDIEQWLENLKGQW